MASSHKGHSDSHWESMVKDFATGTPFGRGKRPRKGSKWDLKCQKVEKCPKFKNASSVDVLGRPIQCICGYHKPNHPVSTVNNNNNLIIHFKQLNTCSTIIIIMRLSL